MSGPIIRIRNLYRRFKSGESEVTILKGLNLDIEAGEMVAIIGQSGSGKSTLMNILGCLDRPSDGEYFINGKNATDLSPQERAALRRENIGFIFQRYHLLADLKARHRLRARRQGTASAAQKTPGSTTSPCRASRKTVSEA